MTVGGRFNVDQLVAQILLLLLIFQLHVNECWILNDSFEELHHDVGEGLGLLDVLAVVGDDL